MYAKIVKPILDFAAAVCCILILLLPMAVIAVAVLVSGPGPVLYTQKRVGKGKKLFTLLKFRTMKTGTPEVATHLLENPEETITGVGRFLRKYSLDELPQLFNILTFKMSFVGPRPALWNQDDLVAERDKYGANDVKPGLTGWAQINGRDELPIPVKASYDGEYVKKMGPLFDLKCIFGTVKAVFKADGVVEGGNKDKESENKDRENENKTN
ncbi:MAG: sugar transferase [Clostridia bacterium]|nr:sugar transferase [Clostridia bacterium]